MSPDIPNRPDSLNIQSEFELLFQQYEAGLFRYVMYLCNSLSQAEDLYQETWLRVVTRFRKRSKIRNFKSYLYTTATNLFRDELRKRRVRRFILGEIAELTIKESPLLLWNGDNPDRNIHIRDEIQQALGALTERQRMMFCLSYIEDLSIAEISRITNCAKGTVKSTLYKAVQKMRKTLVKNRVES